MKDIKTKIDLKKLPPIIAAILVFIGIVAFWGNIGMIGNFLLLAILVGVIPYILISYFEYQSIKVIEDQLPVFLLDLAETQKAGMGLPDALKIVSKTDYGKLSDEIKKMNDQLSWGTPLQQVLDMFARRMRRSGTISRVIRIINEAYMSGGDIVRTMEAIAGDISTIKDTEKERESMMLQHVMVMYAIYFIFIGIIIGLSKTLIPMLDMNSEAAAMGGILSFQDPCIACIGSSNIYCISCSVYALTCQMFNLGGGSACYYNSLFLLMVVMQGIFAGLVAGQIGENSVIAGIKHSMIMAFSGFGILMILFQTGLI
ncbi:MAG: type II secretion system F family protein [Candidatus Thermoplasmatota archaeon]|nr:type II secretion system F family protein [Candidatus Thermoplasmatota archaeon]